MGYTHYWTNKQHTDDQWSAICSDAHQLVRLAVSKGAGGIPIPIAEEYDQLDSPPVINDKEIRFNGVGDDGHETMLIDRTSEWTFCKTAFKPYDAVVVALLAICHHHNPDFTWTSDGEGEDHDKGMLLVGRCNPEVTETGLCEKE